MLGVGVDIVSVDRFESFKKYSHEQLRRIFSENELTYCKTEDACSYLTECLAARFAVKEAFFKALSAALVKLGKTDREFSFLFSCKHVEVVRGTWEVPELLVDWKAFEKKIGGELTSMQVDVSLSHEKKGCAVAIVILYKL